jgi:ectoine hydroxylase-related dioxygenase (phytanoyl-CoA dioxygenase family)
MLNPETDGAPFWLRPEDCRLDDLVRCVERRTDLGDYPLASQVEQQVLIYDCDRVRELLAAAEPAQSPVIDRLLAEWGRALLSGPGLVVLKRASIDMAAIDALTHEFRSIIDEQHASGTTAGDHFAKPGANDRIWNVQQKLCLRAPEAFARYYGNPVLALICRAWLGPAYQMTAQVNVVNPGGAAQSPHRDFHLGFMSLQSATAFPGHVHQMSAMLTLQGAMAHCDMPVETGPTLYLPYSQTYPAGYVAYHLPAFRDYFEANKVQLPLQKGDAVFFNPALFHAAGHNRTTDVHRIANLIQVSSGFGRAMESLDRKQMCKTLYPALLRLRARGELNAAQLHDAVAACAEGYAFPSNLDRDQPVGGMAPPTQQEIMRDALAEEWPAQRLSDALDDREWRQQGL